MIFVNFDATQTFRKGAAEGPARIKEVLKYLETYVNGFDLSNVFIKEQTLSAKSVKELLARAEKVEISEFPVIIGGEHTVSYPFIKKISPELVLWADAHPDCEKKELSHDSVCYHLINEGFNVAFYGLRTLSLAERDFLAKNKIKVLRGPDLKIALKKRDKIYLSFDLDIIDPSIIPAVGNPEPSGLSFAAAQDLIKALAKKLCAVDFVEYTPLKCDCDLISRVLIGKLIYSTLAEICKIKG